MSNFTADVKEFARNGEFLKPGKIIDVSVYDGSGERTIRRIKIKSSTLNGGAYSVSGTNVKGKLPITYLLPAAPDMSGRTLRDATVWVPFDDSGEVDE